MSGPRVFLSHVGEEAPAAQRLKTELEAAVPGAEVFVSAIDIPLGDQWLGRIDRALADSRGLLVLCSPRSIAKPWINFESGAGWGRELPVIPVCYGGLRKERLPYPLSMFQARELERADDCHELARRVAEIVELPLVEAFDADAMAQTLAAAPERTAEIGIVLAHGQDRWRAGPGTVFSLPRGAPPELGDGWRFRGMDRREDLAPANLAKLAGLVMASPWHDRVEPDEIAAIIEWVNGGGRLLLLGFELGDRHHGANLNELAMNFGFRFATDIVGPPAYRGKPYAVPVEYDARAGDPHPLTSELTTITLPNVQTLSVEPGAYEWLRVGANSIYRPSRESVHYREGLLTQPGGVGVVEIADASWVPVAAEAPPGLCGDGSVHAIGTWDLMRSAGAGAGNVKLLARLFEWLSGDAGR